METNPTTNQPPQVLAEPQTQSSNPVPGNELVANDPITTQNHCKRCHSEISQSYYFCPHCGNKIKEPPYHFSVISTSSILLISFLFPPFGIIPGFRYLRNENKTAKFVGILAIIVTIASFALFLLLVKEYIDMINKTMNSINSASYY